MRQLCARASVCCRQARECRKRAKRLHGTFERLGTHTGVLARRRFFRSRRRKSASTPKSPQASVRAHAEEQQSCDKNHLDKQGDPPQNDGEAVTVLHGRISFSTPGRVPSSTGRCRFPGLVNARGGSARGRPSAAGKPANAGNEWSDSTGLPRPTRISARPAGSATVMSSDRVD